MNQDSIQSKRQEVWTRMYEVLDLNPGSPAPGGRGRVAMTIIPVVSVDALLVTPDIRSATVEQNVGTVTYHTVPDNEKWLVFNVGATRFGGDRDVVACNFKEPENVGGNAINVFVQAAAGSMFHMFQVPILLQSGWEMRLRAEGGTTDGNYTFNSLVYKSPSWLT